MITTNLLKEIEKESIKIESHDNEIVKQVQLLLDTKGQQEKSILEKCGLDHHIKVAENITGESIERKGFFDKYGQLLTRSQVEAICYKYALRCLHVSLYEGNIGPNVAADVNRFVEKHGLEPEMNSGNFKSCLYIMAPKGAFKLEKKPVDPVLFYCPNKYLKGDRVYIPVSKWGTDFTFIRRIQGWFTRPIVSVFTSWFLLHLILITASGLLIPSIVITCATILGIALMFLVHGIDDFLEILSDFYTSRSYDPFDKYKN